MVLTGSLAMSAFTQNRAKGAPMEAKIPAGDGSIALVNVFTVQSGDQQRLAAILREGTEAFFSQQPGSISSSVLVAKDGSRLVNYSQWRSIGDIAAFREKAYFKAYIERIGALATVETLLCDIAFSHAG
ncbi:antibiotic biosynthesis monooxygenase [Bosea sp. LjRoot90]|uniref:antibiotic biosynthesis monooxygenase family protein n=1 Tax=Bosea sp. LjRoot90 TaxID=3342342 RepID=UPI003ECF388D